jgi:hypothetical protein
MTGEIWGCNATYRSTKWIASNGLARLHPLLGLRLRIRLLSLALFLNLSCTLLHLPLFLDIAVDLRRGRG